MSDFIMAETPVNISTLRKGLVIPEAGGFCSFEGWIRQTNEGRAVSSIDYSAFVPLALTKGQAIVQEAKQRFAICRAIAMHWTGYLPIGETAAWIGVSAAASRCGFRRLSLHY